MDEDEEIRKYQLAVLAVMDFVIAFGESTMAQGAHSMSAEEEAELERLLERCGPVRPPWEESSKKAIAAFAQGRKN